MRRIARPDNERTDTPKSRKSRFTGLRSNQHLELTAARFSPAGAAGRIFERESAAPPGGSAAAAQMQVVR